MFLKIFGMRLVRFLGEVIFFQDFFLPRELHLPMVKFPSLKSWKLPDLAEPVYLPGWNTRGEVSKCRGDRKTNQPEIQSSDWKYKKHQYQWKHIRSKMFCLSDPTSLEAAPILLVCERPSRISGPPQPQLLTCQQIPTEHTFLGSQRKWNMSYSVSENRISSAVLPQANLLRLATKSRRCWFSFSRSRCLKNRWNEWVSWTMDTNPESRIAAVVGKCHKLFVS